MKLSGMYFLSPMETAPAGGASVGSAWFGHDIGRCALA